MSTLSIGDSAATSSNVVGAKAAVLARLHAAGYNVPPHVVVSTDEFAAALAEVGGNRVDSWLDALAVNRLDLLQNLEQLRSRLVECAVARNPGEQVLSQLQQLGVGFPLAVRSSAIDEDGADASLAGAYDSILNVQSVSELSRAIGQCWASLYGDRSILARQGSRLDLRRWAMAVLCQPYLTGPGGVAFSREPGGSGLSVLIEADPDGPACVTAGTARWQWRVVRGTGEIIGDCPRELERVVRELTGLVLNVERLLGTEQDIEWVWSGDRLWLLQARPVTGRRRVTGCGLSAPVIRPATDPGDMELGACAGLHDKARRKKIGLKLLADRLDLATSRWYYVRFDVGSLAAQPARVEVRTPYVYVDVDDNIQAVNVPVERLDQHLGRLARAASPGPVTVRLRESIPTELALISSRLDDGGLYVEYVAGAMKGLASGMATPGSVVVAPDGSIIEDEPRVQGWRFDINPETGGLDPAAAGAQSRPTDRILDIIGRGHEAIAAELGQVRAEWWVWGDTVYWEDYSEVARAADSYRRGPVMVLSDGSASGTVVRLSDLADDSVEYMSHGFAVSTHHREADVDSAASVHSLRRQLVELRERCGPLILVADRPLLVIATVLDLVSGLVVGSGGVLCHLAIIARESGVPVLAVGGQAADLAPGQHLTMSHEGLSVSDQ